MFDEETGKPLLGIKNRTATQNYIEVPLLFSYYWRMGESRYVVLSAGPYVAYGVGGKQKTKGDTEQSGVERYFTRIKLSTSQAHTVLIMVCRHLWAINSHQA